MRKLSLPRSVVKKIMGAVDSLYDRAIAKILGRPPVDKRIYISSKPRVTLSSLFEDASAEERTKPDTTTLATLLDIAEGFINAQRHATKAHVVKSVENWLNTAQEKGVDTDVETVLGGELAEVWRKAHDGMTKIVAAESNVVKNTGGLNGIIRVNAASGVEDPVVYFVVVRDTSLCDECKRLHLMEDEVTPRLWYLSELGHGYHKKGQDKPKLAGLHPNCRCTLSSLLEGWGFDGSGMVSYKGPGYSAIDEQRGIEKSERLAIEELAKSTPKGLKHYHAGQEEWDTNGEYLSHGDALDYWLEHMRKHSGIKQLPGQSEDEYAQALYDHMNKAPVTINFPGNRMEAIGKTGRFLNSLDTLSSPKAAGRMPIKDYNYMRVAAEHKHLGIPETAPSTERPVYGAVNVQWNDKSHLRGGAYHYGDMYVTLKPHVKKRTTFTPDDTFCLEDPGLTVTAKHLPKMFSNLGRLHYLDDGRPSLDQNYIEAQIHGGVDLNHDVESIHIGPNTVNHNAAIEVGKKYKIPVYKPYTPGLDESVETRRQVLAYHPDFEVAPEPPRKTTPRTPAPEPAPMPVPAHQAIRKTELTEFTAIGDVDDFNLFKAEKPQGVFVAFKGSDTGIDISILSKMVQESTVAVCPTARIFLNRKNFKIFVKDREQADAVIARIQAQVLGGD